MANSVTLKWIYEKIAPKTRCYGCLYLSTNKKKKQSYSFAGIDQKKNKFVLHDNSTGYVEYHENLDKFSMLGLPIYYGDILSVIEILMKGVMQKHKNDEAAFTNSSEFLFIMQVGKTITSLRSNKDLPLDMACDNQEEFIALLTTIDQLVEDPMFMEKWNAMDTAINDLLQQTNDGSQLESTDA